MVGKHEFKNDWYVLRDCFIAIILGIILGFLIDIIFPFPRNIDSFWKAFFLTIIQLTVDGFIVYYYSIIFEYFFKNDSDAYRGFTVFSVLFFLVQIQLLQRLQYLYLKITGTSFE